MVPDEERYAGFAPSHELAMMLSRLRSHATSAGEKLALTAKLPTLILPKPMHYKNAYQPEEAIRLAWHSIGWFKVPPAR